MANTEYERAIAALVEVYPEVAQRLREQVKRKELTQAEAIAKAWRILG